METVANRYAESLFDLAIEENQVKEFAEDMYLVSTVFAQDHSFVSFFNHVLIEDAAKFDLIDTCFKGQVDTYICNFLKVLVKKRRIRYILDISKEFTMLCNAKQGIIEGVLYTPFALTSKEVEEIEKGISKKENKTVILKVVEDVTLIGGIKIELENRIIDGSIKSKMELLKKELLRK